MPEAPAFVCSTTTGDVPRMAAPPPMMIVGLLVRREKEIRRFPGALTCRPHESFDEVPMKVDWTTDGAGQMLGFSYHDASLVGLEWEEKRYLRIRLATPDGVN